MAAKVLSKEKIKEKLQQIAPHIQILEYGGSVKNNSKFIDTNRNVVFASTYDKVRDCIKRNPNTVFNPNEKEKSNLYSRSKEDAERRLSEEFPFIKILEWSGKSRKKSLFYDKRTNAKFHYAFNNLCSDLRKHPNLTLGTSKEFRNNKRKQTNLDKYGTKHATQNSTIKEKTKQTNLNKYGVEYPTQSKKVLNKAKQTNQTKRGVDWTLQDKEIRRKAKNTIKKKYGVESISQSPQIKEKVKQTNFERYGGHPLNLKEYQEKQKETMKQNHGYEYNLQNEEILQKAIECGWTEEIRKKRIDTNLNKYGFKTPAKNDKVIKKMLQTKIQKGQVLLIDGKTLSEWAKEKQCAYTTVQQLFLKTKNEEAIKNYSKHESDIEVVFRLLLDQNQIKYETQKIIENYRADFYLLDFNVVVEVDGVWIHSDANCFKERLSNYHQNKKETYLKNGYRFIHFYSDEIFNNINAIEQRLLNFINSNKQYENYYKDEFFWTDGRIRLLPELFSNESEAAIKGYYKIWGY